MRDYELADLLEPIYGKGWKDLNVYQKYDLQKVIDEIVKEAKVDATNERIEELQEELEDAQDILEDLEERIGELMGEDD